MRTEEIKIYEFSELSEKAQEKAIEDRRGNEHYLDYDWFDYLHEDFKEELKEIGLEGNIFLWDLQSRNSFGVSNLIVTDEILFMKKAGLSKWLIVNKLREEKTIINNINSSGYGVTNIDFEFDDEDNLSEEEYKERGDEINNLEKKIEEFLEKKFNNFWERLPNAWDFLLSDEAIREDLEVNEYEFLENGEMN